MEHDKDNKKTEPPVKVRLNFSHDREAKVLTNQNIVPPLTRPPHAWADFGLGFKIRKQVKDDAGNLYQASTNNMANGDGDKSSTNSEWECGGRIIQGNCKTRPLKTEGIKESRKYRCQAGD